MTRKPIRRSSQSGHFMPLESRLLMSGTHPLSDVPVLNSLPGATAKLFLDFDGETLMTQNGPYTTTPAFDQDGDRGSFTDGELAAVRDIWARVAEAYSPFNINVTTVDPGPLVDKVSARVLIGGNNGYFAPGVLGMSFDGGFYNPAVGNTSWVYAERAAGNTPLVAEAVIHESAHNFGLKHQSGGDSWSAPIMGHSSTGSVRQVWTKTGTQDDFAILAGTLNGFGYRPDDYGNSASTAAALGITNGTVNTGGVIEKMTDSDWFSFTTSGGSASFKADVSKLSPTLNLGIKVVDAGGRVVAIADSSRASANLGETLSLTLGAGTYSVVVFSHGDNGDVGQYTLTGTVNGSGTTLPPAPTQTPTPTPAPAIAPASPSGIIASAISTSQIRLSWQETSTNVTGFRIERSTDGVNFTLVTTVGASTRSFDNTGLAAGTTYHYRLLATSTIGNSPYSTLATAMTLTPVAPTPTSAPLATTTVNNALAAPAELTADYLGHTAIKLSWKDNATGERGYYVEKSLDGVRWSVIKGLPADTTSYITTNNNAAGRTYQFRVRAYAIVSNKAIYSSYSNAAIIVMPRVLTKVITLI